jgi:DDE superfamily endonuclease
MQPYPSGMTMSSRALNLLADLLRGHRAERGTRWRKLPAGRQALLVLAHPRKNGTYAELACGFGVGTSTAYRYIREALDLLAAKAPTLEQAIEVARRKAFVILDGTLPRIDRVGMASGYDRAFYSGRHKAHGLNVQVIADPTGRLVWISPPLISAIARLPGASPTRGHATPYAH